MANISIVDRSAPSVIQVNNQELVQKFFRGQGYSRIRRDSKFMNYTKGITYNKTAIYDILIITTAANLGEAETLIPKLDAECEQLRKSILRGFPLSSQLEVKKHHFMKLRKSYTQYSYKFKGLPTGFLIRPLILLKEEGIWDYIAGRTARVDIISLDEQSLNFYIQRHQEYLESRGPAIVNSRKFHYWKTANILIDYGHYLIIGLWILDLICNIFQTPFPFKLGGMIFLTASIYSSFLGITYLLHKLFKRCQINELRDIAPSLPTTVQRAHLSAVETVPIQVEEVEIGYPSEENQPQLSSTAYRIPFESVEIDHSSITAESNNAHLNVDRIYKEKIQKSITILLTLKESKMLNDQGHRLLQKIFYWILGRKPQGIPRNASLPELLKKIRKEPIIEQFFNSLKLWVSKLDTETPFAPDELMAFKKFLLLFLYNLKLLPRDLKLLVEQKYSLDQVSQPPIPITPNLQKEELSSNGEITSQMADFQKQIEELEIKEVNKTVPDENRLKGVLLCKFDEERGYIPINVYPANILKYSNEDLFKKIARNAIGFGTQVEFQAFTLTNDSLEIYCLAKRFSIPVTGVRGGSELYSLVIFSRDSEEFPKKLLGESTNKLKYNWNARSEIIETLYDVFNSSRDVLLSSVEKNKTDSNLEVASVPQTLHAEIAGINAPFFRIMQKSDVNGIYCIILVDSANPNTPEILSQFVACTKDLDVRRNYIDKKWLNDPLIKREFSGQDPPAVMVGCGLNSQVIPFGERGDDIRLHSLVAGYLRPNCQINLKDKEENNEREDTKEIQKIKDQEIKEILSTSTNLSKQENIPDQQDLQCVEESINTILNHQKIIDKLIIKVHLQYFKAGCVMIDGSNIVYLLKDNKVVLGPRLDCVLQVVDAITAYGIPRDRITIYFDSNFEHKLKNEYPADLPRFKKFMERNVFRLVPSGSRADATFIQVGKELKRFIVITNDLFKEHKWLRLHRVGVGLQYPDNIPYLAIDSAKALIYAFYGKDYKIKTQKAEDTIKIEGKVHA